jgi:predicted AAA+ superfamily ATPase
LQRVFYYLSQIFRQYSQLFYFAIKIGLSLIDFILRRDELAMLARANEEQAAIGILPRRLRR